MHRGWILSALVVGITLAVVLGLVASGKGGTGGFLGSGPLLSDINLLFEVLLVLGLTAGMRLARAGNIDAHRRNQTTWVIVNLVFVAFLMIPAIAGFKFNGLRDLRNAGNLVTWVHVAVGTCTVVAALWLVLQMNGLLPSRLHVQHWRRLMRLTLAGYWIVAILGIGTYRAWYAG